MARWVARNGTDVRDAGRVHAILCTAAIGCGWLVRRGMWLFEVLLAQGDAVMIERRYHRLSGKSRERDGSCRARGLSRWRRGPAIEGGGQREAGTRRPGGSGRATHASPLPLPDVSFLELAAHWPR